MTISEDKRYDELGQAWRQFVSWRDKIFAGYMTVLATLGYGVLQNHSFRIRAAIFGFSLAISVVFRILDYRTTDLIDLCQVTGQKIAGTTDLYGEMEDGRFA